MKTTFKSKLLLGAAVTALSFGVAGAAEAAAIVPASGANTVTGADTIDAAAQAGATDADVSFAGAGAVSLTITGAGTTNLGAVTLADDGGTKDLVIGDGTANTVVIFNGAISGDNTTDANDLDIDVDAANGGAGNSTLTFMSNVTLNSIALTLDGDADGTATVGFAGSSAQTFTGTIEGTNGTNEVVDVDNDTTIVGTVGATTAISGMTVATGKTLTLQTTGAANKIGTTTLTGTGNFTIDTTNAGGDMTLTGAVAAATDGDGVFKVTGAHTVIVTGAVGASGTDVGAIQVTGLTTGKGLTLSGDTYANGVAIDATNATDENTVTFGDGADTTAITGSITSAEDGEHTLVFNSSTAASVTGNVGASGAAFKQVTMTEGATFGGDLYATATTVANGKTLVFTGTGATVATAFDGSAGNITVGDGTNAATATFTGAIDNDAVTVEDNSTATFNETVTTDAALVVGGTTAAGTASFLKSITIGTTSALDGNVTFGNTNATTANVLTGLVTAAANQSTTITAAGQLDLTNAGLTIGDGATDSLTVLIKKTDTFDPNDADGDGTGGEAAQDAILNATGQAFTRTGTLTVGLASDTQAIDSGTAIVVAVDNNTGAFATGLGDGTIVLQDSALLSLQNNTSTAGALNIIVSSKSAAGVIGADAVGVAGADTLLALSNASISGELETIKGSLQGAQTAAAAEEIAESIVSTVDGGNVVGATVVANASGNIVSTRMASLSNGETGMTAGNISQGLKVWAQGFGQTGEQDRRDGVDGFDVDTYGLAVGIDTETLADNWIWGLAFAYADSEVDSNNANSTNTEIDTYQFTLYANYDWDDATYFSGQLSYAFGDNDTTRSNVGGISGLTASGDFDSDTFSARFEAGRSYEVGSNTTLTPKALVNYMHYDADSYTETGAGTANLIVDQDDLDIFELGLGVDASWLYQQADGSYLKPVLSAGVRHDLIGDEVEATNTFTGGGTAFNTQGFDPAQTTFNLGAGVTYYSTTNWELSAEYDFEIKSDYDAHAGVLRAAYKF